MIKRIQHILTCIIFCATAGSMSAQNIQLHYDFGRHIYSHEEADRQSATITLEQFKADKWGSWYYFVDVDLSSHFVESAYTEISREFKLGKKSPLAAHVEFDGGLSRHASFQQAALLGCVWNGHNSDFSTTYSVQLMYKQYFKSYSKGDAENPLGTHAYASAQLTGVWSTDFAHKKCTFSGFIDFWRGEQPNHHGQLVILTEPQLWYHANEHLSLGGEVEISNHFIFNTYNDKHFFVNPTLAVKWNF